MKLYFLSMILFISATFVSKAQDSLSQSHIINSYHEKPLWIDMMNDPKANYYETCKAFYSYWQGKELPAESEGEAKDLGEKGDEGIHFKDSKSYAMIYEYKRFKNWERTTINHIDPASGRILTEEELIAIWQTQTQGIDTHIK